MTVPVMANPRRGEAEIDAGGRMRVLRPTFAALAATEDEIGSLFALVERAGEGGLRMAEIAALFWHCCADREGLTREGMAEAIAARGLAACAPPLRTLLVQILQGRP